MWDSPQGERAMDRWDVVLLIVAGYVSVLSLVRLMANRRNELVSKIREEIDRRADADAAEEEEQEAA
jgi:hypothetical protein